MRDEILITEQHIYVVDWQMGENSVTSTAK